MTLLLTQLHFWKLNELNSPGFLAVHPQGKPLVGTFNKSGGAHKGGPYTSGKRPPPRPRGAFSLKPIKEGGGPRTIINMGKKNFSLIYLCTMYVTTQAIYILQKIQHVSLHAHKKKACNSYPYIKTMRVNY